MSKIFKEGNYSITRDLKIDENAKNNYTQSEIPLNSITKKFLKEPLTLELFDKKFHQMYEDNNKKEQEVEETPKKKSKRQEGKAIFYDIFIKPKEEKIKEIIDKRIQKTKASVTTKQLGKTYISNKINSEGKILGLNGQGQQIQYDFRMYTTSKPLEQIDEEKKESISKTKKTKITKKVEIGFKNEEILQKNFSLFFQTEENIDITLLNKFLHEKYILNKNSTDDTKKNFFNQLIQIRPPEGINAVVASPLMESKGWAPSIPSVNIDKLNTNLKDLMIRAKGGIKNNDIIKEAHMAFYLGIMNEEEKRYEEALKFYKKYFLSAKLLQDIYGTELALNRIAVLFSNIFDYEQSIYYNEKHKEITTHNLNGFVAFYNCGICYRVLENFDKSIENFQTALKMSADENDLESYTLCLAQLSISYIFIGDVKAFKENSYEFSDKNRTLGHKEMDLEMQILSGYIYNYTRELDIAKDFYKKSFQNALLCESEKYKSISLCNMGIIEADKDIDDFLTKLGDPELSKEVDLEYKDNDELILENQLQEIGDKQNLEQEEIDNGEQVNNGKEYQEGEEMEEQQGEMNGEEYEEGQEMEGQEMEEQQEENNEEQYEEGQQMEDNNENEYEGEHEMEAQQEEGEEEEQQIHKSNETENIQKSQENEPESNKIEAKEEIGQQINEQEVKNESQMKEEKQEQEIKQIVQQNEPEKIEIKQETQNDKEEKIETLHKKEDLEQGEAPPQDEEMKPQEDNIPKQETIDNIKEPEKKENKEEIIPKQEEPKVENTEEPKVENTEEPKVENTKEPKVENTEEPKIENKEEIKVENKEESKTEVKDEIPSNTQENQQQQKETENNQIGNESGEPNHEMEMAEGQNGEEFTGEHEMDPNGEEYTGEHEMEPNGEEYEEGQEMMGPGNEEYEEVEGEHYEGMDPNMMGNEEMEGEGEGEEYVTGNEEMIDPNMLSKEEMMMLMQQHPEMMMGNEEMEGEEYMTGNEEMANEGEYEEYQEGEENEEGNPQPPQGK